MTPQSKVPQVVDLPDLHPYGDADKWAKVMEEKAEQLNSSTYIAFWKPIAEFLKKQAVKTVYLSGDHIYSQVNLDAMFVESINRIENGRQIQEQKYVADYWRIILINSTAKIAEIKARPKTDFAAAAKRGQSATLVGRPKYGLKTIFKDNCSNINRRGEVSEGTLEDLPCTEKEIMQTETLLKSKGINSIILLRDKATEGAIKKIKSPFMLLLATHGDYRSLKNAALIPLLETTLPYFRIYFTGASDTTGNREEDGILTGLEIQSMELDSTELVFLSSCNSGQGYVGVGDLAYNLPRAFAIAGARQVLTTLRPIGDEDAAVFVETFYKNWIELGDASLAFRATQFELRKKNSHPKTWGAFVLIQN